MSPRGSNRAESEMVASLVEGRSNAPFSFLGVHPHAAGGRVVRAFLPAAAAVEVVTGEEAIPMERIHEEGVFQAVFPDADHAFPYRLSVEDGTGERRLVEDPYRFGPTLDEERVQAFLRGEERRVHQVLGALPMDHEGVRGTRFAVWAPHARAVGLNGEMNDWDARRHPMRPRGATGVWELFVPGVEVGARYKYRILNARGEEVDKADPCGRAAELRPATASEVWAADRYEWGDGAWMEERARTHPDTRPMSVYEVHLGSWRVRPPEERGEGDHHGWLSYRELADELLPYVKEMGFTHLELLPIVEHPLDQSWGYQPLGFFAPTSRYGNPDDFRHLVDRAHQLGLGVILDWVPGHFPTDGHGLVDFDGTPLYEDSDPDQAYHPDWGTLVFDYGKPAVRSFLVSSALHWLEDYHLDGLRVDAVASMLYLDYSRPEGSWTPNPEGGRENLEAVELVRAINDAVHQEVPGAIVVAEESTSWPKVSHGTDRGGLGFDQKWNMGWMNDTLEVMGADPLHRKEKYERFTFSLLYAFSERFVLPLSHDEVVHEKGSLIEKMPGDREEKFANLRLLLAYMWAHPGKKLLFMGGELAQWDEWNVEGELDWALEGWEKHAGVQRLVKELNRLYAREPALHVHDFRAEGFEWIECDDADRTILAFLRWAPGREDFVAAVGNFTPVRREGYRLPVPREGRYRVILDTDATMYGGGGGDLPEVVESRAGEGEERDHVVELPLPGLAALFLKPER